MIKPVRVRKVATLYLLENEGFHSGKDEGNITKAAQRHGSNPAWRPSRSLSQRHRCPGPLGSLQAPQPDYRPLNLHTPSEAELPLTEVLDISRPLGGAGVQVFALT